MNDKIGILQKKLKSLQSKPDTGESGRKKVDVLNELAYMHKDSDFHKTEKYSRQALVFAKKLNYERGIALSNNIIGIAYMLIGVHDKALNYLYEALKSYKKSGDWKKTVSLYHNLGLIDQEQSKYQHALDFFLKALNVCKRKKDRENLADTYGHIGTLYKRQGHYSKALCYHSKALRIYKEIKDKDGIAGTYGNTGNIYRLQGSYEKALDYHFRALKIYEKKSNLRLMAFAYNNIGLAYNDYGDLTEALKYYLKAVNLKERIGDRRSIGTSYSNVAVVYGKQGNYEESLKNSLKALEIHSEVKDRRGVARASDNIGLAYYYTKKYHQARKFFLKSLKISKERGDERETTGTYLYIGITNLKTGHFNDAIKYIKKALCLARRNGQKKYEMDCCEHLSVLLKKQNKHKLALKYFEMYHQLKQDAYNAEKSKQMIELKTKYAVEKKEKEAVIYQLRNIKLKKEIKERKELERELKKHRDDLEELVKERTTQLRALAHELSLVEEHQRRKMAAYLHDEVSQKLALAAFKLDALEKVKSALQVREEQKEIKKILDEVAQLTRTLTFEISPPVLYEFGLEAAIEWLARQFSKNHKIPCKFKDDGETKPLADDTRILLFQSVRELLANVSKHARADSVTVSATKDDNVIRIKVNDNGIGFDPNILNDKIAKNEGFGLFNVRERLKHLKGNLNIESKKGYGTAVTIIAPLGVT